MAITDKLVLWFIRNIIMSQHEIIDKPGFLINRVGGKNTYLRDLLLPEKLLVRVENTFEETYGGEGAHLLYSVGKKFGYLYSHLSHFPNLSTNTPKEIEDIMYLFTMYVKSIYAEEMDYEVDMQQKKFTLHAKQYMVCRFNGRGYLLTEGGMGGVWAYLMSDPTIEAVHIQCMGRNDPECTIVCAPLDKLREIKEQFYTEPHVEQWVLGEDFYAMNAIAPVRFARNSLKTLLDAKFFDYSESGHLEYGGERFFHCDASMVYLLEGAASTIPHGEDTLYRAVWEYGKEFGEKNSHRNVRFLTDILPAFGWGDVNAMPEGQSYRVLVLHYPWFREKQGKRLFFAALVSGMLSGITGKEIRLSVKEEGTTEGHYALVIA